VHGGGGGGGGAVARGGAWPVPLPRWAPMALSNMSHEGHETTVVGVARPLSSWPMHWSDPAS
jgi:hypothetical protein